MKFVWPMLETWLNRVEVFRAPRYSIFQDVPDNIYSFPPSALLLLLLGNLGGEEPHFRSYLMKKTAFLGKMNWAVSSMLFALYHL
jgi:membrane protease YdiL (CAAX protease family)